MRISDWSSDVCSSDLTRGYLGGRVYKTLASVVVILALAGCNTKSHQLTTTLNRPANQEPRIVLMPLDVELSTLSAGGVRSAKLRVGKECASTCSSRGSAYQ